MYRFALAVALICSPALAQQSSNTETDRIAVVVLKEMHNRGAELYNANDHAGCLKVYTTALLTTKPFLKHRPAIQKAIDDGLAEVDKLDSPKAQAYRLHEIIGRIHDELKADPELPKPVPTEVAGVLALNGQPLEGAAVTLTAGKRAFTAISDAAGRYAITDPLPLGTYTVIISGGSVPAKYQSSETSGLVLEVVAGKNTHDVKLQSK